MGRKPSDDALNEQQTRFCREYVISLNGTKAAILAGYSVDRAATTASELLADRKIAGEIAKLEAPRLTKADVTADSIIRELARLARADVSKLFDEGGNLKPIHTIDEDTRAAIAGVEVVKRNITAGDDEVDVIHKIKLLDKTKALDVLAKHLGLLLERVEHSGGITVGWKA